MSTNQTSVKHHGSVRMFENEWLEKLSRSHFLVPLTILSGIAGFLFYRGLFIIHFSLELMLMLSAIGFLSWTLAEYLIHRFVFHMTDKYEWMRKIQYIFHGVHHEYPKDKGRIVMPPAGAILLGSSIFTVLYLIMGSYTFAFGPGFLMGYVVYAFVHYAIHAYAPPKNFLKWLWINHSIHHYREPNKAYGVSSPLWDYVFGTNVKRK